VTIFSATETETKTRPSQLTETITKLGWKLNYGQV